MAKKALTDHIDVNTHLITKDYLASMNSAGISDIGTPDHLMFGGDFPFLSPGLMPEAKANIDAHPGLDTASRAAITCDTVQSLFPRLAARM